METSASNTNNSKSVFYPLSLENQMSTDSSILAPINPNFPSDYDQSLIFEPKKTLNWKESNLFVINLGNLPVEVAIKKFESLNAKKPNSLIATSPTTNLNPTLPRSNTLTSDSSSPTNLNRNSSLNNNSDYLTRY